MTYKFSKGHAMNDQNASATEVQQVMSRVTSRNARLRRITRGLLASLGLAALVLVSATAQAQVAPPLGVAQQFGVLGSAGVTAAATGSTVTNGDVGSATTVTGNWTTTPPYIVHTPGDAVVTQALIDATAASTNLLSQGPGTLLNPELGGTTRGPGIYSFASTANIAASTIFTLSGAGNYVFLVPDTLTANVLSNVILVGVDPCQVFWRVGSTATINSLNFPGTVIAGAAGAGSVIIGDGSSLSGRAVSLTAAVTTAGPVNNIQGCSPNTLNVPLVIGPVAPTVSKSFSPTSISVGGVSTLTVLLSNTSTTDADTVASLTDNLPTGMVIAPTPNASTTCSGGSVTAPAGGGTVTLTGGTIPMATLVPAAAGSCTVSVNVTAASAGTLTNTVAAGGLVTNNGNNAAPASAVLTVTPIVPNNVPTLSEWAMIMLVALLAMTGFVAMRRQV